MEGILSEGGSKGEKGRMRKTRKKDEEEWQELRKKGQRW